MTHEQFHLLWDPYKEIIKVSSINPCVALSDPGSIQFSYIMEQSPRNWKKTMRQSEVLIIVHAHNIDHYVLKLLKLHFDASLVSNHGENVMKWWKTVGQICPIVFLAFKTFSSGLENNKTSKCDSESFPTMVTYILCVENCQSYILTHNCIPIPGRLFYNVRKSHGPRIWEWNLS